MTDYDSMSVDEWLQAFFMAAMNEGTTVLYDKEVTIDEIKRELRSAVIREERQANDDRMGYNGH